MKTIAFPLVALGALLIMPAASWADSSCFPSCVILEEATGSIQVTQFPATTTLTLKGFSPALGTLDEVHFDTGLAFNGNGTLTVTYFNPGPFPEPGGLGRAFVGGGLRTPSGSDFRTWVDEFDCSVGPLDLGASMTTVCVDFGVEMAGGLVPPENLAEFVSTGNVLLPIDLGVSIDPFFDTGTPDSASMNFELNVGYVFTPAQVPEPSSSILLIIAFVGAGPRLLAKHCGWSQPS